MFFYTSGVIVNSTTGPHGIVPEKTESEELLRIFKASVLVLANAEGDVTHEDLRLIEQEILRRLQTHPHG